MPKVTSPPQGSTRTLLVVTRFTPLNGLSGTGTYLFSMLSYLRQHGVKLYVCWSERPGLAARRGWWIVPKDFSEIATLLIPGSLCFGRLRLFPSVFVDPLKARLRGFIKAIALAFGLGRALGISRPQPAAATEAPSGAPSSPPVVPYAWDRPPDPYEHAFFGSAIAKIQPDALAFNYCWMTPIISSLRDPDRFLKIAITYDLRHIYSTLVDGKIRWSEGDYMSKELETDYLRLSDALVAIRGDDAETFQKLLPDKEVVVAYPALEPCLSSRVPLPNRCLFVAADNLANREGLLWFLEEAWPIVRAANPAAHLHICGTICKALTLRKPGVEFLGFVDSLDAVYQEASVVIVPLLRGSGVKIKLMEGVARGKACVSTPIGAEGVPALDSCVAIAGTADAFAAQVLHLLADPSARRNLEDRAALTVREHFSAEACYGAFRALIQKHPKP
ncbi:MAG: glycosyltransferase [Verrucomicrobia bacterium]|nr:glycosyltransferase [Verrucomicrobiota bacterium]